MKERMLRGLGVLLSCVGTAVSIDEAGSLRALLQYISSRGEWLLLGAALALTIARLRTRTWLIGPGLFVLGAGVISALRHDIWRTEAPMIGVIIAVAGAALALRSASDEGSGEAVDPTMSATAIYMNRTMQIPGGVQAPDHLTVRAIAATLVVDLREASRPSRPMRLDATCLAGGAIKIRVPPAWPVVAGRLVGWSIEVSGTLDSEEIFDDPTDEDQHVTLMKLRESRRDAAGLDGSPLGMTIVVNILAFVGRVDIENR